jgi:hypothetical protein
MAKVTRVPELGSWAGRTPIARASGFAPCCCSSRRRSSGATAEGSRPTSWRRPRLRTRPAARWCPTRFRAASSTSASSSTQGPEGPAPVGAHPAAQHFSHPVGHGHLTLRAVLGANRLQVPASQLMPWPPFSSISESLNPGPTGRPRGRPCRGAPVGSPARTTRARHAPQRPRGSGNAALPSSPG